MIWIYSNADINELQWGIVLIKKWIDTHNQGMCMSPAFWHNIYSQCHTILIYSTEIIWVEIVLPEGTVQITYYSYDYTVKHAYNEVTGTGNFVSLKM